MELCQVFVFNPFSEARIAHGPSFTPPKHQAQLQQDLANLPQFLGGQGDVVLVSEAPSAAFLSAITNAGIPVPEFVVLESNRVPAGSPLLQRAIGGLRPWAWGPDSLEILEPLFPRLIGERRESSEYFNERIARLYSKAWSAELLRAFLSARAPEAWLCPPEEAGVAAADARSALAAVEQIRRRGHHKAVIKEAHGLAGANAIRLWEPEILETQRRWIERATAKGRQVVVEPWLEREADFSIQLEHGKAGLKVCGYTGLVTDLKGQFQSNYVEADFEKRLPRAVPAVFKAEIGQRLQALYGDLFLVLERELRSAGYLGPVSIDAFVYWDGSGNCRVKPVVEINPRYTMGRVLVELMKHTAPGSAGTFKLVSRAAVELEGFADFPSYARAVAGQQPIRLQGGPQPRIVQGALCLADPQKAQVCLPLFEVAKG